MTIMDTTMFAIGILLTTLILGYFAYMGITLRNLRKGRWKNGVGGLYFWSSNNNGIEIFFIPMRKSEIEYADAHPEKWLKEQGKWKWRIRRVHIAWLPWYLLQDPSPEKFCEGLMNYFEKEAVRDDSQ